MVVLSVMIRFWQERKSNRAADKLKAMVSNTATVIRHDLAEDAQEDARRYFGVKLHPKEPRKVEMPIKLLVPGDLVVLSAGDMIPADCRVLSAKDLFVSQAAMTGESLPGREFTKQRDFDTANILELENILFHGHQRRFRFGLRRRGQHRQTGTYFGGWRNPRHRHRPGADAVPGWR